MEYIIVKVEWPASSKSLSEKVQAKIEDGFEPVGGMSTWDDKLYNRCYAQAMIRTTNVETVGDKFIRGFTGRGEEANES
jgi:hypothetical protein